MRSPNWKEEELKLALELYLSKDLQWLSKMHDKTEEIVSLSLLLKSLKLHKGPLPSNFRSPGSIRMKLSNFKALDERYGKSSLTNIGATDKAIWSNYHDSYNLLLEECQRILKDKEAYIPKEALHYVEKIMAIADPAAECTEYLAKVKDEIQKHLNALRTENDSVAKQLVEDCNNVFSILENYNTTSTIDIKSESDYTEHAGVNQKPISKTNQKIGEYVRTQMLFLIENDLLTDAILADVTDPNWSRKVLHLGHPFFIRVDLEKNLDSQLRDENGYVRYWKKVHKIKDNTYCICKEWYESGRKHFDRWISSLEKPVITGISEAELLSVLNYIKITDKEKLSISRDDLYLKLHNVDEKEKVIQDLLDLKLLSAFQGTERELVVEDYDLLYRMISNPKLFI